MADRLLSRCLWMIIMGLIVTAALGCLILVYSGLFRLISFQWQSGGMVLGAGVLLGTGCWALCRHSDDLIDRRM
jgi:high-affinity Fe2+/Pb2+ permease